MAMVQISILSGDEIRMVHEQTLKILSETGVRIHSQKALDVLESGGAAVDGEAMRAFIPEELVKETLRRVPKSIRLCARNPRQDMPAPKDGPPYMATNGTAVYMTDLEDGSKRTTTTRDLKDFIVLCDAMEALDYAWPIVTAHDAPTSSHALRELWTSLSNTTKHVQGEAMSGEEAIGEIEVGAAIAGGADALSKRPLFSVVQCPICPLEFEKGSVEAVMEFAKAGIPVVSMSMALCGLTSPVTLAGTIAVVNAENIASFAISQMTRAGAPVIYSSESAAADMLTGEIHYGSVEEMLMASASAQMAKHYGIPSMVGGFGVGLAAEYPGINTDASELIFSSMTCATSTDYASGIGGLAQAKGASLEQIVIDCDLWEMVREFRRKIVFDAEHFVNDLVKKVGPGGTFLREAHTARNMRKELFLPSKELSERLKTYRSGLSSKDIVSKARERVRKTLASHRPEPLDGEVVSKVNSILSRFGD
jgi:trimethylamine--corrinoid protein Co-methyltransferase